MKKILLFVLCCFCVTAAAFAGVTAEVSFGIGNNTTAVNGKTFYQKNIYGNYVDAPCDYKADYSSACVFDNLDLFINNFPLGFHFACGIGFGANLKRDVADHSENLNDTEFSYNSFFDIGAVYAFPINKYFFLCAAPAFSMLYAESKYKEGFYSRYTVDDVLCFGVTGDLYLKFKYKHFVARAGCAASYYPSCEVISADTKYDYSSIKDVTAYNIRPYISAGVVIGFVD